MIIASAYVSQVVIDFNSPNSIYQYILIYAMHSNIKIEMQIKLAINKKYTTYARLKKAYVMLFTGSIRFQKSIK